ncbi:hypothetical protein RHMOL_Rhmol05G0229100 [Rhododendron molle]|uniref:Uncharacterized protein n=1 Tax=Rhododendron molle TaxID=49168 RepID=A0ACC0NS78_RHOML|nr:hypothetical protein RHMOL_Rhmol05G0229100 [Rhododendron molle]
MVWLSHWKIGNQIILEAGDEVNVSAGSAKDLWLAEEIGVDIVYDEPEEKGSQHHKAYTRHQNVTNVGDLSEYQFTPDYYHLCHHGNHQEYHQYGIGIEGFGFLEKIIFGESEDIAVRRWFARKERVLLTYEDSASFTEEEEWSADIERFLLSRANEKELFASIEPWNAFRFSAPKVDWHKVVWFKHHVLRWAIVQWLCILGRLATKDRLHRWGVIDCATGVLCTTFDESHEHLFFGCPFSTSVWQYFLVKNSIHRPCFPLLNEIQWINVHRGGANLQTLLVKLSCAAVVYHLWRERNTHIFQGMSSTPDQIISVVASDIRGYVSSCRNIRKSDVNRLLCLTWNISGRVFVNS